MRDKYMYTDRLAVGYGNKILIDDIDINVEKGQIIALIGPNGAGKSTILKPLSDSWLQKAEQYILTVRK